MTPDETPSDAQMTDEQAHQTADRYVADREANEREEARTAAQPTTDERAD